MGRILIWVNSDNFNLFMKNLTFEAYSKQKIDSCVQLDISRKAIIHTKKENDNLFLLVNGSDDL